MQKYTEDYIMNTVVIHPILSLSMQAIRVYREGKIRLVDICFEDGNIVKGKRVDCFLMGKIAHPTIPSSERFRFKDRVGEEGIANNGLRMTIIKYNGSHDVDIVFEDCTIVKHKVMWGVRKGSVAHPKYLKCEHVATFNNEKIFLCTCKKCKGKHTLKLSEMKDFECTIGG